MEAKGWLSIQSQPGASDLFLLFKGSSEFRMKYFVTCFGGACVSLSMLVGYAQETTARPESSNAADAIGIDIDEFNELLKQSKWEQAGSMIDEALAKSPSSAPLLSRSFQLASRMIRENPEASTQRMASLIDSWCSQKSLSSSSARELQLATSNYTMMLTQQSRAEQAIEVANRVLKSLEESGPTVRSSKRSHELLLARLLSRADKANEAQSYLQGVIESLIKGVSDGADATRDLVMATNTFDSLFQDLNPKVANQIRSDVELILEQRMKAPGAAYSEVDAFATLKISKISQMVYSDPETGLAMATELMSRLEGFESSDEKQIEVLKKRVTSLLGSIETSLSRLKLVGTEAPDYEAISFVGMEPASLADLKGKVVLLDFWAVWCGPCIATFPHLRDWHDLYSDKGFIILGITSDQGYTWDESNQRAVRGTDVSHDEELKMLASFRNHYELKHGFVITPKGGEYNRSLGVSGIPQAVLLDKQGKIRMIKVGSGESNARALESEIQKLLQE
jgi:thiol-disulfide isomerase/thioredoxin